MPHPATAVTSGALLLASVAFAHDPYGQPNWIANGHYTSPIDGSHCCGVNDCMEIPSENVREVTGGLDVGGFMVLKGGDWVPASEVVPHAEVQRSRDGNYWRCKKPDGSRRCFFAPPPST